MISFYGQTPSGFFVEFGWGGVKVDAATDSAARAGIREGDVIVAIGNTEISTVKEFDAALARVDKSKALPVLVHRGELATYLVIRSVR